MAIQNHPLANSELGQFVGSNQDKVDTGKWETQFDYEKGYVILTSDWRYQTFLDKDIQSKYKADIEADIRENSDYLI